MFRRKRNTKPKVVEVVIDDEDYYYDNYYDDDFPRRNKTLEAPYGGVEMSRGEAAKIGNREMAVAQRIQTEQLMEEYEELKLSLEVSEKKLSYYEQTEVTNKLLSKQNNELKERIQVLDGELQVLKTNEQEFLSAYQKEKFDDDSKNIALSEATEELNRVEAENENLHELFQEGQDDILKYQEIVTDLKQVKSVYEEEITLNKQTIQDLTANEKKLTAQVANLRETKKNRQEVSGVFYKEDIASAMIDAKQIADEIIEKAEAKERMAEQEYQQMQEEFKKLRASMLEKKEKSDELLKQLTSKILSEAE